MVIMFYDTLVGWNKGKPIKTVGSFVVENLVQFMCKVTIFFQYSHKMVLDTFLLYGA